MGENVSVFLRLPHVHVLSILIPFLALLSGCELLLFAFLFVVASLVGTENLWLWEFALKGTEFAKDLHPLSKIQS